MALFVLSAPPRKESYQAHACGSCEWKGFSLHATAAYVLRQGVPAVLQSHVRARGMANQKMASKSRRYKRATQMPGRCNSKTCEDEDLQDPRYGIGTL